MTRRLIVAACVLLTAAACSSGGSHSSGVTGPGTSNAPDVTMVSSTSLVPPSRPTLRCNDQIGWRDHPPSDFAVVLGNAGVPTKKAFAAIKITGEPTRRKFWAKQALLVKAKTSFELIVPAAWADRATMEWGNPGTPTTHLWVSNCKAIKHGTKWLAYAGGFKVTKPACVPLIVKVGTKQKTVHVGVGKACAGQARLK